MLKEIDRKRAEKIRKEAADNRARKIQRNLGNPMANKYVIKFKDKVM